MPTATTGDCSNVTKNSATVSCTYENVPAGGVCGVEYTWNEGSVSKSIGSKEGAQEISLSGLKPGTTYTYCAYIEANGQTYYGGDKTFTTEVELPDLLGIWNCKEYRNGNMIGEATFELLTDGTLTSTKISGTGGINSTDEGTWSITNDGKVSISLYYSDETIVQQKSYNATIDISTNTTMIEGTASLQWYSYVNGRNGGYTCNFVMTK